MKKYMIQPQTKINVIDNSGAKIAKCFKVKKSNKKSAKIGDIILVSIQNTKNKINNTNKKNIKLKPKQVFKGLVVTSKSLFKRINGFYFKFSENSIVLLDKNKNLLGNKVNGLLLKNLKTQSTKLVNFSKHLI